MNDVLGQAINQYQNGSAVHKLWINNKYGPREEMPVETYFRDEDDMPDIEWLALNECRGRVLDIGAGAGSHALLLQERELTVTALDISPLCVKVMQERGVKQALEADIYTFNQGKFDTLLLLMNGVGLSGTLDGLKRLLVHLKTLLANGGQILFDSSDVAYLYEGNLPAEGYYGEIWYQYEFENAKTEWFRWLYIDEKMLQEIVTGLGFNMEVLLEDEYGQYLVRLTL